MAISTSGDPVPGFRHLVRYRDFRLIWLAQLAAQLADKFLMFSLIILAYHVSGKNTPVAAVLLAYTVPAVAIAPVAGVFADRLDRKVIMVSTNLGRAALITLIPLTSSIPMLRFDFLHLLVITFAFSAVGQLFSPAEAAAIPSVVPRQLLMTANSMVMVTMVTTLVIGGALAPIVSRVELYAPYWIAAVLFGVAGSLITLARVPRPDRRSEHLYRSPFWKLAAEVGAGWQTLQRSPLLLFGFCQLSLAVLVMFMMFTLAPAYVSRVIGISAQDSYIILVPATGGCLVSALLLGNLGPRLDPGRLAIVALVVTGLTLLALAGLPDAIRHFERVSDHARWVSTGFSFLLGLEFGTLMIPALSQLMEHSDDSVRGRLFALLFMVVNGVTALPVLLAAALSDLVGTGHVVAAMGSLLICTAVLVSLLSPRLFGRRELL
jgi:DHA3 family macrolide efflux protein-like MFS transporter